MTTPAQEPGRPAADTYEAWIDMAVALRLRGTLMPDTTYDVRIWNIEAYVGKARRTCKVVWWVAGRRFKKSYRTTAGADSFRSELVLAQRKGEAFDIASGLPVTKLRREAPATGW
jgi:hypothetical protein